MINRLVMEQFGPFRGRVELDLAGQGLVLIRARNEVSAAADSNGSGKTSILHAICWGLFGEDLAGRRADAVVCRFTEGMCLVRLEMEDALGEWGVQRTRRPAGLSTYGIPGVAENEDMASVQEKVEQRLGFGIRTFKNAVVFGQGAFDRFAGAGQEEQMRMLDEIQGVDFRDALKRAQAWRVDLQAKLHAAIAERLDLTAKADTTKAVAAQMRRGRDQFEAGRQDELRRALETRQSAQSRLAAALADIALAAAQASELLVLQAKRAEVETAAVEVGSLATALSEARADLKECEGKDADLDGRLADLMEEGTCPTCRQPVKSRQAAIRRLFAPELKELGRAAGVAERRVEKAAARHAEASERHALRILALIALQPPNTLPGRYISDLEYRCSPAETRKREAAKKLLEQEVQTWDMQVEKVRARTWEGQDALVAAEDSLAALAGLVEDAAKREEKVQVAVRMAEYWVEAFGDRGVRSLLVDGVADFMNERIAAHLEVLAAGEATTRMSAQTELKRGGARERISFRTEWAWGGAGPDDGSGGQDRRKDLAVFAAAQDLAESRSARPFPIRVFDEPFDALDSRGKELAVEWVRRFAQSRGTALLVTHSEELAALAEPDRVWTVVMDKSGARVEVS